MVCLALCVSCRFGDHDWHVKDYALAQTGMLGGFQCPCVGDCAGNMPSSIAIVLEMLQREPS